MPPLPPPLNAEETLAREWPSLRSGLLDLASAIDRLERAGAIPPASEEASRLAEAIALLAETDSAGRAKRIQELFSRPYDPAWRECFAAGGGNADGASTSSVEAR